MHRILIFMKRKPGLTPAEFREHYEERHVPVCMPYMQGARRYRRHYLEPLATDEELPFDVMTELWFDDRKTCEIVAETMARNGMPADVIEDEERFLDRSQTRTTISDITETEVG